jgi:hypothetical protein
MKKKSGIPPYNDPADGPLTPEQIEENVRMSVDTIAAINIAFDNDMSSANALSFVKSHRTIFERIARDLAEDQAVSDTARVIHAVLSEVQRGKAKQKRPKSEPTCRSITIAAMAKARRESLTLEGFFAAAEAESLEGLSITRKTTNGVIQYEIDAEAVAGNCNQKKVAERTFGEWWAEAGRQNGTN